MKHHIVGPVTDMLIGKGIAPPEGQVGYRVFRWAQRYRDSRVLRSHALYALTQEQEWDSTYALSRASLLWLWDRAIRTRPHCIVDIGGGRSTVMFAQFARHNYERTGTTTKVVSVEHDPKWQVKTKESLDRGGLGDFVYQLLAPLKPCSLDGRVGQSYELSNAVLLPILEGRSVDLLVIDGPPGGEVGRHHALSAMIEYLAPGASVFVDDVERPGERDLIQRWSTDSRFDLNLKGLLPFECGFAWFIKRS